MTAHDNGNGTQPRSSYLEHLPALYRDDEFMGQFLLIFESIMQPLENTVGSLPFYFDPTVTPESVLEWLARSADMALDTTWPIERRRELVKAAIELYRWRGTRRGLAEHLRIYTGAVPEISEHIQEMRLDHDTRLGINTQLGTSGAGSHFTVSLELDSGDEMDIENIRSIIEVQKPAHTAYTLQVRYRESKEGQGDAG